MSANVGAVASLDSQKRENRMSDPNRRIELKEKRRSCRREKRNRSHQLRTGDVLLVSIKGHCIAAPVGDVAVFVTESRVISAMRPETTGQNESLANSVTSFDN